MSISKRLFIGNIHPDVGESDLRTRFANFGIVHNVEVRSKSGDPFAFLNMEFQDFPSMKKCVDVMNKTKWKGLVLKVEYAKESFMEKLKRERQQSQKNPNSAPDEGGGSVMDKIIKNAITNGFVRRNTRSAEKPKKPDNFNFEIVGEGSSKKQKSKKSEIHSYSAEVSSKSPPKSRKLEMKMKIPDHEANNVEEQLLKSKSALNLLGNVVGFNHNIDSTTIAESSQPIVKSPKVKKTNKISDSGSSSSDSENEKDGIPRFRGLASFIGSFPVQTLSSESEHDDDGEEPVAIINTVPIEDEIKELPNASPPKFKLKINPQKKAKSDELRLNSLAAREETMTRRSLLIRSSLSKIEPPPASVSNPPSKESLFAENENGDDEDEEISFNVRPEYEGATGQKNLKLKSKFGNDDRFKLDNRFAESNASTSGFKADNSEKESQLEILEKLVGPTPPTVSKPKTSSEFSREELRTVHFDPTNPEHFKYILNLEEFLAKNKDKMEEGKMAEDPRKKAKKDKRKKEEAIQEEKAKLKEPMVKATFKIAENINELFAKESESSSSFSLLKTFGGTVDAVEDEEGVKSQNDSKEEATPIKKQRKSKTDPLKKNPFKYDSSSTEDEEETNDTKKSKKSKKAKPIQQTEEPKKNFFKNDFFKKESFFFSPKDSRLKGIFQDFLTLKEDPVEVSEKFNNTGRTELKAIAKSKMKNSKRKIEKKVNIMRKLRKKKRRDAVQKQQSLEKRKQLKNSSN